MLHTVHVRKQDLSFQMACFQGYTDIAVLLPRTREDTHKNNTHLNTHAHTQARAHTCKHMHTAQTRTHQKPQIIKSFEWLFEDAA